MEELKLLLMAVGALAALLAIRRLFLLRELHPGKLRVVLGHPASAPSKWWHRPVVSKRHPLLVYGIASKKDLPCLLALPVALENLGGQPIQNVTVQVEYPACFQVKELENELAGSEFALSLSADSELSRNVSLRGSTAVVRLRLKSLRPGEQRVLFEPIRLRSVVERRKEVGTDSLFRSRWLSEPSAEKLIDVVPLHAFVYSDSLMRTEVKQQLVCVQSSSFEEIPHSFASVAQGVWGRWGEGRPSVVISFPWERLRSKRSALYFQPALSRKAGGGSIEEFDLDLNVGSGEFWWPVPCPLETAHSPPPPNKCINPTR